MSFKASITPPGPALEDVEGALTSAEADEGGCGPSPKKRLGIALAVAAALSTSPPSTLVAAPSLAKLSTILARVVEGEAAGARKMLPPPGFTVTVDCFSGVKCADVKDEGEMAACGEAVGGGATAEGEGGDPRRRRVW